MWEDKNGNKRKSTEIIAENVGFGESKSHSDDVPNAGKHAASAGTTSVPAGSYSGSDNIIVADDEGDLPF